jgi:hypothetical protein
MLKIVSGTVFGLLLSSCIAQADGIHRYDVMKTAVGGERTFIGTSWKLKSDCSFDVVPSVTIIDPPQHGRVELIQQKVAAHPSGEYARCGTRQVPGITAYYTPRSDFVGRETFSLRTSFKNGTMNLDTIHVNVLN